jgi:hypothetical protein
MSHNVAITFSIYFISSTECNKAITLYEVHRTLSLCCIQWTISSFIKSQYPRVYQSFTFLIFSDASEPTGLHLEFVCIKLVSYNH